MKERGLRILGGLYLFLGIFLFLGTFSNITGFAISEKIGVSNDYSLYLGVLFFLTGSLIVNSSRKKGQAAMEFLMTYGWAILAALIVIAALAYFGVFSPSKFLPNACTLTAPLGCKDYQITTTGVNIIIINGIGSTLTTKSISISGCGNADLADHIIPNGDTLTESIACSLNLGEKFKGDIKIDYLPQDHVFTSSSIGIISGTVIQGSISSSSNPNAVTTPTGLAVNNAGITTNSIPLTWTSQTAASSYKIYKDTSAGGTFTTLAGTSTTASFTATEMPATTHYYKVTSLNSTDESQKSSPAGPGTTNSLPTYSLSVSRLNTQCIGTTYLTVTSSDTKFNCYSGGPESPIAGCTATYSQGDSVTIYGSVTGGCRVTSMTGCTSASGSYFQGICYVNNIESNTNVGFTIEP